MTVRGGAAQRERCLRDQGARAQFGPMFRSLFAACLGLFVFAGFAAAAVPPGFSKVDVAPTRTSIYIGMVSMTMPTFVRERGEFTASYAANVIPFFFYNEKGTLGVQLTDEQLEKLARAEQIEFTGKAVREDGEERRVEGRAVPADGRSGKIKVRVFVTKDVELIFNTTYAFHD